AFAEAFVAAWRRGGAALASLLADEFVLHPGARGRDEVLELSPRVPLQRVRIGDVCGMGPVVTIDLLVDWELPLLDGGRDVVADWPLQLQVVRANGTMRALRLQPRLLADQGRHDGRGGYVHAELRARVEPVEGSEIGRLQD